MSSINLEPARPKDRHARRTHGWIVGLALTVLLLLYVGACQVLLAPDPEAAASASAPVAVVTTCQPGAPGGEVLCGTGASVAVIGQRLAARDLPVAPVAVVLAVLVTGLLTTSAAARAWSAHGPPWARRRAPWGRDLLHSVGIARI